MVAMRGLGLAAAFKQTSSPGAVVNLDPRIDPTREVASSGLSCLVPALELKRSTSVVIVMPPC